MAGTFGSVGTFTSTALGSDFVQVVGVYGVERLGQLYEFTVTIVHAKQLLTEDEISNLLLAPCSITFENGDPIDGIAREVAIREALPTAVPATTSSSFPRRGSLTVSKLSRVYQKMSVKDMAADVLGRYGLAAHSDLRIDGDPREFCMQYEESDWDYLQRWFEHEGFFDWFEHSASGEKLVVADANSKTTPISGTAVVALPGSRWVQSRRRERVRVERGAEADPRPRGPQGLQRAEAAPSDDRSGRHRSEARLRRVLRVRGQLRHHQGGHRSREEARGAVSDRAAHPLRRHR